MFFLLLKLETPVILTRTRFIVRSSIEDMGIYCSYSDAFS